MLSLALLTSDTASQYHIREITDQLNSEYSGPIISKLAGLPPILRDCCTYRKNFVVNCAETYQSALDRSLRAANISNEDFMADNYKKQLLDRNSAYLAWNLDSGQVPPEKQREAKDLFLRAWQNARKTEKALELLMVFFQNL